MPVDYSKAITAGVFKWLDANREPILDIVKQAIEGETKLVMNNAVDLSAAAIMARVGKFLDENKNDIVTGIAGAIALSWQARQHPLPPMKGRSNDILS